MKLEIYVHKSTLVHLGKFYVPKRGGGGGGGWGGGGGVLKILK